MPCLSTLASSVRSIAEFKSGFQKLFVSIMILAGLGGPGYLSMLACAGLGVDSFPALESTPRSSPPDLRSMAMPALGIRLPKAREAHVGTNSYVHDREQCIVGYTHAGSEYHRADIELFNAVL